MSRPLHVLLIEDNADDAALLMRVLQQGDYDLTWTRVDSAAALQAALVGQRWDIVISDYSLPQFDGLAALRMVKGRDGNLPFILVSGTVGEDVAVSAMRAGANDYVMKDKPTRLLPAVERELREADEHRRQQAAQKSLAESEERFRRFMRHFPGLAYIKDSAGKVLFANEGFATYLGLDASALPGKTNYDLFPREFAENITRDDQRILSAGESVSLEETFAGRTWATYKFPLPASGTGPLLAGFTLDVTEIKRLQKALLEAQKMESIGRLAGGVAHDFNNLLQAILGYTELLLSVTPESDDRHADLLEIRKTGLRAAELTRQLLAFARKQPVSPKALDLNEAIEGLLRMLRRLMGEHIELIWMPGPQVWPAWMDPSQVDQILANLLVNARDAIHGQGRITIATCNITLDAGTAGPLDAAPGDYILLTVRDNGSGMEKEVLEHMFEPFFTTKGMGTGLGLATVYGIIKQNKGVIAAQSEPGKGTAFHLYLPRYAGVTGSVQAQVQAAPGSKRQGETVLLVEDEVAILTVSRRFLEPLGYRVLAANTPGEALKLAGEFPGEIDLLVTDVVMPEMSGRDLAQRLLLARPRIKLLFMSGYTADIIAHHGVLEDGVSFIQKPFSIEGLALKMRQVLDGKDSERQKLLDVVPVHGIENAFP